MSLSIGFLDGEGPQICPSQHELDECVWYTLVIEVRESRFS